MQAPALSTRSTAVNAGGVVVTAELTTTNADLFNVGICKVMHFESRNKNADYFLGTDKLQTTIEEKDAGVIVSYDRGHNTKTTISLCTHTDERIAVFNEYQFTG